MLPIDPNPDHPHPLWDEFFLLVEQARGGDPVALDHLRGFLEANPDLVEHVGDLATQVERAGSRSRPAPIRSPKRCWCGSSQD